MKGYNWGVFLTGVMIAFAVVDLGRGHFGKTAIDLMLAVALTWSDMCERRAVPTEAKP